MKNTFKRILLSALSTLLIVNMIPGAIYADEIEAEVSEAVQENIQASEEMKEEIPTEIAVEAKKEEAPAATQEAVSVEEKKEEAPAVKEEKKEEVKAEEKAVVETNEAAQAEVIEEAVIEEVAPKPEKIKVTVKFVDIMNTNGTTKTGSASSTLSANSHTWRILAAKFNNQVTYKDFSVKGTKYHFTGNWAYEDGTLVSIPMELHYDDFNEETTIYVHPIYEIIEAAKLNYYKIDRISTGSGSWANTAGSFTTYTNELRTPDAKAHYQFMYWQDAETGKIYYAGDKYSIKASEIGEGKTKEVKLYAMWQPSVTVRYHGIDGSIVSTNEAYEDLNAYGYNAPEESGCTFLGWSNAEGNMIANDTVYTLPALTCDPVQQKIVDLYAVYSTSYEVHHYTQELDGSYSLKETEHFDDIIVNTQVNANAKEYEGFSFDENSQMSATAKAGLVLDLYYNRNSYEVSYEYENAPENAPALPETKSYLFGADVKIEEDAVLEGYSFSGWNTEDFQMPSNNVIVKGSFEINTYTVRFLNDDGTVLELDEKVEYGTMASYDGEEPVKASDGRYSYTFKGWSKELSEVKEDQEYIAQYDAEMIPVVVEDKTDNTTPVAPVAPTPASTPKQADAQIVDTPTPTAEPEVKIEEQEAVAEIVIEETAVPKAEYKSWALYNLLAMIVTILTGLFMGISFFRKKDENEEEEENEDEEENKNGRKWSKFLGIIPMVVSVIAFILTEDMRNAMVLIDRYTLMMVIIALINLVLAFITRNKKENKEEEENLELAEV